MLTASLIDESNFPAFLDLNYNTINKTKQNPLRRVQCVSATLFKRLVI